MRYFNGICTRFGSAGREGDHLVYVARLRPRLWLASRRSDCKIFQFKKVPDIITEVLARYGYPITKKLTKTYRQWDYCVQYQETDMNFVMRLMEHEGIYFSFEHAAGTHTLVIRRHGGAPHAANQAEHQVLRHRCHHRGRRRALQQLAGA